MDFVLNFLWIYPLAVGLALLAVGFGVAASAKLLGYQVRSLCEPFRRPNGTNTYPDRPGRE